MRNLGKSVGTALAILLLFFAGTGLVDGWIAREGERALQRELTQAAAHCYAVEGRYPPDLAYLKRHYRIRTEHRRYTVKYRRVSPDRAPSIEISRSKGGASA